MGAEGVREGARVTKDEKDKSNREVKWR